VEALESAVENYKALAKLATPHTDQAKEVIKKLIQLRLKLLEAKVIINYYSRHLLFNI